MMRLNELAALVGGRLIGDGDVTCTGANPPRDAVPGEITFLDDPRKSELLRQSRAVAVVCGEPVETGGMPVLVCEQPRDAFAKIVAAFRPTVEAGVPKLGIDPTASLADSATVHPSATIGANVRIGARVRIMPGVVVLANTTIGDDCVVHPNVTIYESTVIGDRVVIHAGSVIGAHGFGYRQENGRHQPTPQLGYVEIESDVEIGACVTIDRGTFGPTRIGEGTKIDNQVMVAHNCRIGRHNLLCSQVGIAGSCETGDYVVLAGQVGLKDHIKLGDRTIVGAQAGVMDDCAGDQVYLGSPATPQREQMQIMAVERRLPEMRRELKELRRELDALVAEIHGSRQAA